jgi:SlyX protein
MALNLRRASMEEDALEKIETKLAFLERANSELSDVVFRQQRVIDALRAQVANLASRMQASQESEVTLRTPEEERPPHY